MKPAWRVTLKRPGKRTRSLIVYGCEPTVGDTVKINGAAYTVAAITNTSIIAAFETHGKVLKQVYPPTKPTTGDEAEAAGRAEYKRVTEGHE